MADNLGSKTKAGSLDVDFNYVGEMMWFARCRTRELEPLYLRRVDKSRNMRRFYKLCLAPTLFGEVMLVRNWGRVGTNGQVKFETFEAAEDAEKVLNRIERSKRRRGYVDC